MFSKFIEITLQDDIQYKIYDSLIKDTREPYFFKNKYIDNNVYLAQNTLSIKKAIQIYLTWKNENYNPSFNPTETDIDYGFILYKYTNNKNVKPYYIKGVEYPHLIKIIGFKIFKEDDDIGKTFYTVLLPL